MPHLNVEIKAYTQNHAFLRETLRAHQADFRGTDHQVDTYFHVPSGRMKLREGNIEHSLIYYERTDQAGPKASHVHLYKPEPDPALKALLLAGLGVWKIVDKQREIYFVENVKFHLDTVQGLGTFVEIEAIDFSGDLGHDFLQKQCETWMEKLHIQENELLTHSYSDLV